MFLEYSFTCPLPNGVHARPASALEEVARGFESDISLLNRRTGRTANAKSVLSIVGADVRLNDPCILKISGLDQKNAIAVLESFLRDTFPKCDEALPVEIIERGELHLPPLLRNAGATLRQGKVVVPGIGLGRIVRAGGFHIPSALPISGPADLQAEKRKIEDGLEQLISWYTQRIAAVGKGIEGALLVAHRSLARDLELRQLLLDSIVSRDRTAAGAIADAEAHFTAMLAASDNALLRERSLDIQDVCSHLLRQIYGNSGGTTDTLLDSDSVVVAEALTPCQFLAIDRRFLKGLVLSNAGTTSHTVILARSLGIPTLVGVEGLNAALLNKQEAVVDADLGALVTNLTDAARRYYAMESDRLCARQAALSRFAFEVAATRDGHKVEIAANIATVGEASLAFAAGAEGIGLFRTEMLFSDRDSAPSENEQYQAYRQVLEAAAGKPVVIRSFDVGGDKPVSYLNLPVELNPFLGYRAVRLYPKFEALLRSQIRALLRAAAHGPIKLLIPMIATLGEVRWIKAIIAEEQTQLAAKEIPIGAKLLIGAMIEVPAAAFSMPDLCRELDFFSIGSNDLLQYFMAADRANSQVAGLYNPLQPAFLRLLKQIVDAAHLENKWIGLCGEMGGQCHHLPLLVGLGLDEISASSTAIAGLKAQMAQYALADCQQLLASAMNSATAEEVAALIENFLVQNSADLLAPELIMIDAVATSKEEVIKRVIDRLYVQGRTENPRAVEEAVWQREATYSTGFGYGFAIPHCKSNAVQANSLAVIKLQTPVVWGALDGAPVRVIILLAMRETKGATEHMRVFSKLARQVMHEEFRAYLESETDDQALCAFLKDKLGIVSS